MLVLYLTRSPVVAGWAAFAVTAPGILAYIPAGALVDRWDPGRAMLFSELGRGVAVSLVLVALALRRPDAQLQLLLLIVAAVTEGVLAVFSTLAERRYLRSLVEPDQVSSALVRSEARNHMAVLIGRPLGGFLFGIGFLFRLRPVLPFLVDGTTFLFSVGVLSRILWFAQTSGRVYSSPDELRQRHLGNEILVGLRWVRDNKFARVALPLSASTTLIFQALIMVFLAQAHAQHLSPIMLGIVLAASGVGGALGSVTGSLLPAPRRRPRLQTQMWCWAAAFAFLAPSSISSFFAGRYFFALMAVAMALLGFTGALSNIELDTYLIQNAGETMLARVMSVGRLMSLSACAIGLVLGGMLAQWQRGQLAVFCLFIAVTVLAITSSRAPSMRMPLNPVRGNPQAPAPDTT
jgi:MFS family permease